MMGSAFPIETAAKTILTGAALLFLGACASVPVEPENEQQVGSAQILSICEKLAKSDDTRIAIGLCEKAHIDDPDNPVPLLILGDMLQQQGALAQAGRAYGMAIDLDPENVEAHYGLGKVFLARNQFELATEQFEVARELNDRDHRLYNALGVVLDNLGDHVAAQEHYRIGLELAPNNRALKKNLTLSRRLDNSVSTPAIGPQYEVVPAPASRPGDAPGDGGGPAVTPVPSPQQRQAPGAPGGRLGHEPLAQVPQTPRQTPPQKTPSTPDMKALAVQATGRQFAAADRPEASAVRDTRAAAPLPAGHGKSIAAAPAPEMTHVAYFPMVAPEQDLPAEELSATEQVRSEGASLAPAAMDAAAAESAPHLVTDARAEAETALPSIQPNSGSIQITAAPLPAPKAPVAADVTGPKIIAAGLKPLTVEAEPLAAAPAPQPAQTAALHDANQVVDPNPVKAPRKAVIRTAPSSTRVPTSIALGLTAETSASSRLPGFDAEATAPRQLQLSVDSNQFGVQRRPARSAAAESVQEEKASPRVTRLRFGREHEDDHETRHMEGEFWDLVDVINPMQHIPVVASIYRDVTEDEIKPAAKIAGGTLFGGVLGFASSIFDSVVEEVSGQDMAETAVAALTGDEIGESSEVAVAVRRERTTALRRQESGR